jgi:DNA-binding CsgD family transcriptional regulator
MGVRVPRITLNADFGDESAFGELSLLSVGYGMHQAWMFATMFGTSSVFGATRLFEGLYGSSISLAYFISIIIYTVCLVFMGLTNQRFLPAYISHKTLAIGGACACIGTALLMFPTLAGAPVLEVASGVLTGVGSSILIIYWGTAFARSDNASIVLNTAIAILVSIALFATVLHYAPWPVSGIATAAVPLLEVAILWNKTPTSFYHRNEVPIFKPLPINRGKFLLRFAVPVFVLGVPLGMLRSHALQNVISNETVGSQLMLALAGGLATVLILITIMALGGGDKWSRFFQPIVPFVAVCAFFIPFSGGDNMLANVFLIVGFLCFEALMWIFFGDLSQRFRLSPIFVFGVGRGTLAAAVLVGTLIPVAAMNSVQEMAFGEQTVIVAMLVIIMIAYAMLPREREMEAIVVPCPLVKAVSTSFEREAAAAKAAGVRNCGTAPEMESLVARSAGFAPNAGNATAGGATVGSAATSAGTTAAQAATTPSQAAFEATMQANAIDNAAGHAEVSSDNAGAGAQGDAAAAETVSEVAQAAQAASTSQAADRKAATTIAQTSAAAETAEANSVSTAAQPAGTAQAETPTQAREAEVASANAKLAAAGPSEARLAMERSNAQGAESEGEDTNEQVRGGGRFRRKCEAVANTFLLSRRETEILFFLAKGHNAAYIQEKLYISEGTAKTHIRHIYRKLDVHSQQELMRTVEDAAPAE